MAVSDLDRLAEAARSSRGLGGGILELGVWKGLSTSALTLGGRVTCVDDFRGNPKEPEDTSRAFEANLRGLGRWGEVELVRRSTQEALAIFTREGRGFRVVLIDASHEEADVYADVHGVWPLVVPGGIVFLDDADWGSVDRAIARLEADLGIAVGGAHTGTKLVRVIKSE